MVDYMITLFDSKKTSFTTNGIGILSEAVHCQITEELNGEYELELAYPIDGKRYDDLTLRKIIVAKPNLYSDPQPFRIYSITKPINGVITINAEHISYDLSGYPVVPFNANNASEAFSKMKNSSIINCPFNFTTDITTSRDMIISKPVSMRSLLGGNEDSVRELYGGEYEFDTYSVYLWENRGQNRGVSIRYGKNLTEFEREEDCISVYTGIYPFWYSDEDGLVELSEKYISVNSLFDYDRIYPLDLSQEWTEKPSESQLRTSAQSYIQFNNIGAPKVSLTVSFVQLAQSEEYSNFAILETVHLGDIVNVEFPEIKVSANAKCIKIVYDAISGKYVELELGDTKTNLATTVSKQAKDINSASSTASAIKQDLNSSTNKINTQLTDTKNEVNDAKNDIAEMKLETGLFEVRLSNTETTVNGMPSTIEAVIRSEITDTEGSIKLFVEGKNYVTKTAADGSYLQIQNLSAGITSYINTGTGKAEIISACSSTYQTIAGMGGYVENVTLDASIGQYIDSSTGIVKITQAVSGTYQTISGMNNYSTSASVTTEINNKIASITLAVSTATSNNQTTSTITMKSGSTTIDTVAVIGTTAAQSATIAASAVNGITLSVSNGTTSSTLTMKNGTTTIASANITFTGIVTFSNLSTSGQTTINGANITTGTISADRLNLTNYSTSTQVTSSINSIVNGMTFTVSNGTTSSTLTMKNGTTTIASANITFTGIVTFSNLSTSGQTTINGANITTGTISADRIDTTKLYISKMFIGSKTAIDCQSTNIYIGGNTLSSSFSNLYLYASTAVYICSWSSSSWGFVFDVSNSSFRSVSTLYSNLGTSSYVWSHAYINDLHLGDILYFGTQSTYGVIYMDGCLYPSTSSSYNPRYLGMSSYPWHYAYIGSNTALIGTSTGSKLGFFGKTPSARTTIAALSTSATLAQAVSKINDIITAFKNLGLVG